MRKERGRPALERRDGQVERDTTRNRIGHQGASLQFVPLCAANVNRCARAGSAAPRRKRHPLQRLAFLLFTASLAGAAALIVVGASAGIAIAARSEGWGRVFVGAGIAAGAYLFMIWCLARGGGR